MSSLSLGSLSLSSSGNPVLLGPWSGRLVDMMVESLCHVVPGGSTATDDFKFVGGTMPGSSFSDESLSGKNVVGVASKSGFVRGGSTEMKGRHQ